MKLFLPLIFTLFLFGETKLEKQIDFLFERIKSSNCTFERNFLKYTPKEAIEHITTKYNYYKDEIKNIDDFIRLSASKSLITGIRYKIICNDFEGYSDEWLHLQIKEFE